jgi:formate hydrogenlyase transcriptional activator
VTSLFFDQHQSIPNTIVQLFVLEPFGVIRADVTDFNPNAELGWIGSGDCGISSRESSQRRGPCMECMSGLSLNRQTDSNRFDPIIGGSAALKSVLTKMELVAPTDATVLVLGETGTGKELIARAIHKISSRFGRPFVTLNCAAIPFDLLESELFGHERGAFTGAVSQKIGRFEMADTGTLFLDEIGDIPLALQPKLLRVLQEQEFERLGSCRTHRVNVRLIAATNQNLADIVRRNEFRSDLYYRLNVFPIVLPPLRERREDIARLVWHFAGVHAGKMGKRITQIPRETLGAFASHPWPGNVRELQNLVERAVILSNDGTLPNPLPTSADVAAATACRYGTFIDSQRALTLKALEAAGWLVGGRRGAAARLGLKRTTLLAKMKKLGIARPAVQDDLHSFCSDSSTSVNGDFGQGRVFRQNRSHLARKCHPIVRFSRAAPSPIAFE